MGCSGLGVLVVCCPRRSQDMESLDLVVPPPRCDGFCPISSVVDGPACHGKRMEAHRLQIVLKKGKGQRQSAHARLGCACRARVVFKSRMR